MALNFAVTPVTCVRALVEMTRAVTLNCSAARYPIVGVELAFPEEEDE